jgi:hypothetical protein
VKRLALLLSRTGIIFILAGLLMGFSCSQSSTQKLATASDAIAHGLNDAQQAAIQATQAGVMSAAEFQTLNGYLQNAAKAGLQLDTAIRNGESAQNVAQQVNVFLGFFNALETNGLAGIKNPQLKLEISTIITGVETSVAIISSTLSANPTPQPAPAPTPAPATPKGVAWIQTFST